ncbi:MAG: desulfoferrodoxin [Candidatus Scalindua sp. AMX11]|nr:MAG: desulfoferrodoxin [Candidatus Scalindua sp.]NOG84461.1 desulfoferrodoxin [Planctomycetota bacterium]RZV80527.1 MAG: desulfoferrodoxin [Candidatus Scalindua sp. SCAELEC01]TDE65255.1 MAG: desulfoferrodoxin [Candidatus Scalindua sp. AMX11]GJQ58460.1 MAG: desulfoferrodoxin [Candidatus Scalindua sp.]
MINEKALFCKLNSPVDADKDSPLAKKHVPVITVPPVVKTGEFFDVTIKVGEVEHPSENEHFIQWIEFYIGSVYLGRFDFAPVMTKSQVTIPLKLSHHGLDSTLRAVSRCNLHGLWEGTAQIKSD